MTRGPLVFVSMLLVVVSGCSSDTTASGVAAVSEGGASMSEGGAAESGTTIDMQGADGPVPTCSDAIKNGDESDVDCGGFCSPCALNKVCRAHSDCASVHCIDTKCLECAPNTHQCSGNKTSACTDGIGSLRTTIAQAGATWIRGCASSGASNEGPSCLSHGAVVQGAARPNSAPVNVPVPVPVHEAD